VASDIRRHRGMAAAATGHSAVNARERAVRTVRTLPPGNCGGGRFCDEFSGAAVHPYAVFRRGRQTSASWMAQPPVRAAAAPAKRIARPIRSDSVSFSRRAAVSSGSWCNRGRLQRLQQLPVLMQKVIRPWSCGSRRASIPAEPGNA